MNHKDEKVETAPAAIVNPPVIKPGKAVEPYDDESAYDSSDVADLYKELFCCVLFVIGSVLYVWLAHEDILWAKESRGVPPSVLTADDDWTWYRYFDDDDYVFTLKNERYWISKYMILYFSAALSFVLVGVFEIVFKVQTWWIAGFLTVGGLFGLLSAMLVERDEHQSNVFNAISVHLYCADAFLVIYKRTFHSQMNKLWNGFLLFGDLLFCIGTFMDVILSWMYLYPSPKYTLASARHEATASYCWLFCALIYTITTSFLLNIAHKNCFKNQKDPLSPQKKQQRFSGGLLACNLGALSFH